MGVLFNKKYSKKMIQIRLDMARQGKSISAFCAEQGVVRKTYYNWCNKYPEFKEAHEMAYDLELNFWESRSIALCAGKLINGFDKRYCDSKHLEFRLKTKFHREYSEHKKVEVTGSLHSQLLSELESDSE